MKKNILNLTALALIATTLVYTGCKKEDTTAPVITLNGDAAMTISLNSTYTEPGATATDDEDGEIIPTVSGVVNEDLTGTYTLTYTATDAAGNVAEETRTVTVVNDAAALAGTYDVSDVVTGISTPFTYTQTITASTTINNRIHFNKFCDYAGNTNIYATMLTSTTLDLPSQSANNIGSGTGTCDVATHSFSNNGTSTISGTTITINYNDAITSPSSCIGASTGVATFTKQ